MQCQSKSNYPLILNLSPIYESVFIVLLQQTSYKSYLSNVYAVIDILMQIRSMQTYILHVMYFLFRQSTHLYI